MKLQKKPALDRHFLVPIVPKWCAAGVRRARIVAIQRDSAMAEWKNLLLPALSVLPKWLLSKALSVVLHCSKKCLMIWHRRIAGNAKHVRQATT